MSKAIIPGGIEHIFKKMDLSESQAKQVSDYVKTLFTTIEPRKIRLGVISPSDDAKVYQTRILPPLFGNKNAETVAKTGRKLEEKIKGNTLSLSAVHDVFRETFNKDRDAVNWGEDDAEQLFRNGPVVIDKYIESFDRITDPIDVQTEIRINLDGANNPGGYLIGYIDILEEDSVVDTKTSKKPWTEKGKYAKHLNELQPKAYSLWFLEKYERMPKQFRYQIVTKKTDEKGNATPETQLISFELKKFELEAFRRRVEKAWDEIIDLLPMGREAFPAQAEVGPLPGRGLGRKKPYVLCCETWCEYNKICTQDGLRIPVKWISKTRDTPGHHVYKEDLEE